MAKFAQSNLYSSTYAVVGKEHETMSYIHDTKACKNQAYTFTFPDFMEGFLFAA